MSAANNGGPAFPDSVAVGPAGDLYGSTGMTLRDYFAAKALPAILSQESVGITAHSAGHMLSGNLMVADYWASEAYQIADAMIAERAK